MKIEKISKVYDFIVEKIIVISFVSMFFVMIFSYILNITNEKELGGIIGIMETLVIISATLAILSFTYAMATKGVLERKNKLLIESGERFFKSTILYIFGIMLLYSSSNILKIDSSIYLITTIATIIFSIIFLFYAVYQSGEGVNMIIKVLFVKKN